MQAYFENILLPNDYITIVEELSQYNPLFDYKFTAFIDNTISSFYNGVPIRYLYGTKTQKGFRTAKKATIMQWIRKYFYQCLDYATTFALFNKFVDLINQDKTQELSTVIQETSANPRTSREAFELMDYCSTQFRTRSIQSEWSAIKDSILIYIEAQKLSTKQNIISVFTDLFCYTKNGQTKLL